MIFKTHLRALHLFAALVAVVLLAACGGDPGQSSEPTGDDSENGAGQSGGPETTSLTVGVIPIAGVTPIHAAIELGYFEEEGLDVTLETSAGGAASLPLVAQGDLHISNAPPVSVILARAQGFDFALLPPALDDMDSAPGQTAVIVAKGSGISELSDLEGKKVAVNTLNSANWLYNRALLQSAGVDISTVTYVEVPFPSMIDALTNGQVDAIDAPQPFHHIALETGETEAIGYTFAEADSGPHITAYAASEEWIAENPNTVDAFLRAMTRAVEHMREDEEAARELIVDYTGAEADLVEQIPIDPWSTELSVDSLQDTVDLMVEEGLIDEKIDAGEIVYQGQGS